ncbi:MAG: protein kinase [Nannocystaceae bacterium]
MDRDPPTRAIDRFEIRGRLGAGAMGVVLEAYDRERRQTVALKTLPNADATALYRFKREFRTLADISHRNLVTLYELFIEPEHCFFTMEKVDGQSFLAHVRPESVQEDEETVAGNVLLEGSDEPEARPRAPLTGSDVDYPRLRAALRQLALGVAEIHRHGKLHRDLKPSNVRVTPEGRLVILDFGLATEFVGLEGARPSDGLTGTAAYMAPEQVQGKALPASDWYAVGVMLYEALTGLRPYVGSTLQQLRDKQRRDPEPPDGLVPDLPQDLASLCVRLLAREPQLRPEAEEILTILGEESEGPALDRSLVAHDLVGRDRHLAELRAALATTDNGEAVAVYIHGPSGTGKSALVRSFLAEVGEDPEALLLTGRCYVHESVPYKALDGVVDDLSRQLIDMPEDEARVYLPRDIWALARLFPVMNTVVEAMLDRQARRDSFDRLELRRKAFAALRDLLARLGDRRRVIVYIDDLQWADADSALLLEELLRPPDPPSLLLLTTFRAEDVESHPFLQHLLASTGTPTCRSLEVAPLRDDEIRDLVHRLLADAPEARIYVPTLVREAAGSPFLAEQLVNYVLSGDAIEASGIGLGEMLTARLRAQGRGGEALFTALAVAAHPLPAAAALTAANVDGDNWPMVRGLVNAKLLRLTGERESLEIYHDRLRETTIAGLGSEVLRDLHRRLAKSMEHHSLDDPEALYGHYRAAGDRTRAALYADKAATRASEALAFDLAATFYRHAIELVPSEDSMSGSSVEASRIGKARLERGLGDALANAGRCRDAALAYMRAAKMVNSRRALELRRSAAEQLLISGHLDEGREVLDEVLAQVGWRMAPSPRRAAMSLFARRVQLRVHGFGFKEVTENKVPPDKLLMIDICWAVSTGLSMIDVIRASEYQARGTLLALEAGEPVRIAHALSMEAAFIASGGGPNKIQASKLSQLALDLAHKTQHQGAIAQATAAAGACAYLAGEWRKATGHGAEAEAMLRDRSQGALWQKSVNQRFNLGALMYLGELAELRRRLPFVLRDAAERGNLYLQTDLTVRLTHYWLAADDPEGNRVAIAAAMARWSSDGFHVQHLNAVRSNVLDDLYTDASEQATRRLEDQWAKIEASMLLRTQIIRVEMLQLRAMCGLARVTAGDLQGSQARGVLRGVERDIKALASEDMPWTAPLAELLRAGLAARHGDLNGARQALERALPGLQATDMSLFLAAAEHELGGLLGGEEGELLRARGHAWMSKQEIRRPDRLARTLVPGVLAG